MELIASYSNPGLRGAYEFQTVLQAAQTHLRTVSDRRAPKAPRRLAAEEVRTVVERYEAGATIRELAAELGVHRTTVAQVLDRAGVPHRSVGLSPAGVTDAVMLYAEGWSTARIGEKYGVHATTVQATLRRAGVRLRSAHRPTK